MTITGNITDAVAQHCNGPSTAKELVVDCTTVHSDEEGSFDFPDQFVLPLPWDFPVGDCPQFIGKTITLTIA